MERSLKGQMIHSLSGEFGIIIALSLSKYSRIIGKRLSLCRNVHLLEVKARAVGDGAVCTNLCIIHFPFHTSAGFS